MTRDRSLFGFATILALALSVSVAEGAHDYFNKAFLGFWEGIDPLDGSTVQVSLSDIDRDGVLELNQRESFFTFCVRLGDDFSSGRGRVTGTGVAERRGVLTVQTVFTCIDDKGMDGETLMGTFEYPLKSHGRILVVPGIDDEPDILLHHTAR